MHRSAPRRINARARALGRFGLLLSLLVSSAPALADEVETGRGALCDMQKRAVKSWPLNGRAAAFG